MATIPDLIQENNDEIRNKTTANRVDNVKEADLHENIINGLQCDWNQTNSLEADYIKNKPSSIGASPYGSVTVGDIPNTSGSLPVSGFITSASCVSGASGISGNACQVTVNFANFGNSQYIVLANIIDNVSDSAMREPIISDKTNTSFKILLTESGNQAQNIKLDIKLI